MACLQTGSIHGCHGYKGWQYPMVAMATKAESTSAEAVSTLAQSECVATELLTSRERLATSHLVIRSGLQACMCRSWLPQYSLQ